MKAIRTGIVGCGKVAQLHAEALAALGESRFTAVFSRKRERAGAFAERWSVKPYSDMDEFFSRSGVEAVIICTPHPFHAEPAVKAAEHGVHVLVEKPLASSLEDCDAMIGAARKAGVRIGMISQRRLYEPVLRVKKAVEEGKIGRPVLGIVTMLGWRDEAYYKSDPWRGSWEGEGGGVLVNQAPHQIDILQWIMGPVDRLYGVWKNLNHPYIGVEDTALAVIHFRNGALGSITVSNSQNPALYGKVHVFGENGASIGVQTDGGAMFVAGMSSITEPPLNDLWTVPGEDRMLEKWIREDTERFKTIDATKHYHRMQIKDFLQAVLEERDPMVSGEEGRKTVEIFTAIYRSNRDMKPVKFPLEPEPGRGDFDGRLR